MNQAFFDLSDNFSKLFLQCEGSVDPKNNSVGAKIRVFFPMLSRIYYKQTLKKP